MEAVQIVHHNQIHELITGNVDLFNDLVISRNIDLISNFNVLFRVYGSSQHPNVVHSESRKEQLCRLQGIESFFILYALKRGER